jgi:hypothetical protein
MIIRVCKCRRDFTGIERLGDSELMETAREKATYENRHRIMGW